MPSSVGYYYVLVGQTVFFAGNAIFFLISGKFNLKVRATDADLKKYYLSKVRNILIPTIIVFALRTLYETLQDWQGFGFLVKQFIRNTSFQYGGIEYWFVFALFGYLLVAPYLAKGLNGLSRFSMKVFFWIGMIYNLLSLVAVLCGYSFGWGYLLGGGAFAFCMGRFIEEFFCEKKWRNLLWATLPLMIYVTVVSVRFARDNMGIYGNSPFFDTSPAMLLVSFALYLGLLALGDRVGSCKIFSFVAKHSFGVYLVHNVILGLYVSLVPQIEGVASIPFHWLTTLCVLVLSLMLAVVLEAVFINPAKKLFDRCVKCWDKLR